MNVNFYSVTAAKWATLETKDSKSFYLVSGDSRQDLYLGSDKISNSADLAAAVANIAQNAADIVTINGKLTTLMGGEDVEGSIAKMIKDAVDALDGELAAVAKSGAAADVFVADAAGKLESENVEDALAEIVGMISDAEEAETVSVVKQDTAESGFAATYYLTQGGTQVGAKINIPKDYFAKDATVKTVTEADKPVAGYKVGQKYIDIEVNVVDSADPKHLYILCDDVITPYTAAQGAAQIQVAISDGNVISASVVAGSIGGTELSEAVNASLALADSAIQADDLGSAAYEDVDAFDEAGAADAVKTELMGSAETAQATDKTIEGLVKANAAQDERLDDLEEAIGEGGAVADQIKAAIEELDSDTAATAGSALTGVTITDGKITAKTEVVLSAENITVENMGEATDMQSAIDAVATALTWQVIE